MDLSNCLIKKGMKKTKSHIFRFSVFRSFEDERSSKTNEERMCTNIKQTTNKPFFSKISALACQIIRVRRSKSAQHVVRGLIRGTTRSVGALVAGGVLTGTMDLLSESS